MATRKKKTSSRSRPSPKRGSRSTKKSAAKRSSSSPKKASAKKASSRSSTKARPRIKRKPGREAPQSSPKEISVFDPDGVMQVLDVMPGDEQLSAAAARLAGMAHESRLKAIIALSVHELCVGDVAAILNLSLSATSTLLKHLRALGFVAARGAGKQTYYRVSSELPGRLLEEVFAAI